MAATTQLTSYRSMEERPNGLSLCFHFLESPLQAPLLDRPEQQIQQRHRTGRDPGMKPTREYIRNELLHSVSHGTRLVKPGQNPGIPLARSVFCNGSGTARGLQVFATVARTSILT
jgi:hypothetical protein